MNDTTKLVLPDGWSSEPYAGSTDLIVLTRPGQHGGYVTVDFKRRIFATGMGAPRFAAIAGGDYKGRDWQRRLVDAAVDHLNDVMN